MHVERVEAALRKRQFEEAAKVLIPELVEEDKKATLDDVLTLTSEKAVLRPINELIRQGIYRAAANDISELSRKGLLTDPSGREPCEVYVGSTCIIRYYDRYYDSSSNNAQQTAQLIGNTIQSMVTTAGTVFSNAFDTWNFQEMAFVAQGILDLDQKVGGLAHLKTLLGGTTKLFRVRDFSFNNPIDNYPVPAFTIGWPLADPSYIDLHSVFFLDALFAGWRANCIPGLTVHELGHIIDYNFNGFKAMTGNVPRSNRLESFLGNYGSAPNNGGIEYFPEALAQWVYDSPSGNSYRQALGHPNDPYPVQLRRFMEDELMVHP